MTTRQAARMLVLVVVSTALAVEDRIAAQASFAAQDACTPQILGPAVVDVPPVAVQPRFRLNRKAFPGAARRSGSVHALGERAQRVLRRAAARPRRDASAGSHCPRCTWRVPTSTIPGSADQTCRATISRECWSAGRFTPCPSPPI